MANIRVVKNVKTLTTKIAPLIDSIKWSILEVNVQLLKYSLIQLLNNINGIVIKNNIRQLFI